MCKCIFGFQFQLIAWTSFRNPGVVFSSIISSFNLCLGFFSKCTYLHLCFKVFMHFNFCHKLFVYSDAPAYHIGLTAPKDSCTGSECDQYSKCEACRYRWFWIDGSPKPSGGKGYHLWDDGYPYQNLQNHFLCTTLTMATDSPYWRNVHCKYYPAAYICRKGIYVNNYYACISNFQAML